MNIQAEIDSCAVLEKALRGIKDNRTPYLDVAAGALQAARENLQYHLNAMAQIVPASAPSIQE